MSVPARNRWTPSNRCPICGGCDRDPRGQGKRCTGYASDDGKWARCSREEYSGALRPDDYALFAHCLDGQCPCGQGHAATTHTRARESSGSPVRSKGEIEATYDYLDETGDLLFQVVRWVGKTFSQRRPNDTGRGEWLWNLQGVRRVLYRLPELLASTGLVIVTEGEKDADALRKRGHTATTSPHGAGKWRMVAEHAAEVLRGRDVVVWSDADDVGRKHAAQVETALRSHARSVRVVDPGKDAHAWLAGGGSLEEVLAAPPTPSKPPSPIRLAPPPEDLPEIQIGTDLERMTDEACAALARDPRVFVRAGVLSGVVAVPATTTSIRRSPDALVIRPLSHATVRERLSAGALWIKRDGRDKSWKRALPPEAVVAAVCARGEWPGARPLLDVMRSPCLRPDGSVLQAPGYDPATSVLYRPAEAYPEVSDRPSLADARGALEALREVVCDFPFASAEHQSAWLAGVLTMLARPAIDGPTPLFAVDATTRGSGKSRLVDAAVRLALGHDAARCSLPDENDELRKAITSCLIAGDRAVLIDNVTRPIMMPALDTVLTSTTWQDRVLGVSENAYVPARAVWWTTGNNLVLGGDLTRRTLHIRLESPLENPEERTGFRHPELLRWLDGDRRRLVACGLTILRGHQVAGAPYAGPLWGSFEDWTRCVVGALRWAGAPDPLSARATASADLDDDRAELATLIDGLARLTASAGPVSVRTLLEVLYPHQDGDPRGSREPDGYDDLRDVLESRCARGGRQPDPQRVGLWLRSCRGRLVSGRKLQRVRGLDHHKSARWTVEDLG